MWRKKGVFFCLLLMMGSVDAQVLRVGMPSPGQVPFLWVDKSGVVTGIYADALRAIASDLKLELTFVPLSQARLNRLFLEGEIDLEIGVPIDSATAAELTKVSLFSRPFGYANEVVIFDPKLRFPAFILKDLKAREVAVVRGAAAPDYITREDFASPLQIAKRVNRGWSDVGLMREAPALHYKASLDLNYKISLPYASHPIGLRLHAQHALLLKQIDSSIEKKKQQGVFERIVCNYLCGN